MAAATACQLDAAWPEGHDRLYQEALVAIIIESLAPRCRHIWVRSGKILVKSCKILVRSGKVMYGSGSLADDVVSTDLEEGKEGLYEFRIL